LFICGEDGIPLFDRLRYGRQPQTEAVLFAFDLLELAGNDLRRTPIEQTQARACQAAMPSTLGAAVQ
jgi:ATP-dependent DNA ligase